MYNRVLASFKMCQVEPQCGVIVDELKLMFMEIYFTIMSLMTYFCASAIE